MKTTQCQFKIEKNVAMPAPRNEGISCRITNTLYKMKPLESFFISRKEYKPSSIANRVYTIARKINKPVSIRTVKDGIRVWVKE